MNWRRGLFRLWLVASLFWVVVAGWIVYEMHATAAARAAAQIKCVEGLKTNPNRDNPFYNCLEGGVEFNDLLPLRARLGDFAFIAAPPIVGSFVLLMAVFWIAAGFKRRPSV